MLRHRYDLRTVIAGLYVILCEAVGRPLGNLPRWGYVETSEGLDALLIKTAAILYCILSHETIKRENVLLQMCIRDRLSRVHTVWLN